MDSSLERFLFFIVGGRVAALSNIPNQTQLYLLKIIIILMENHKENVKGK
jgi:hypothetical protein